MGSPCVAAGRQTASSLDLLLKLFSCLMDSPASPPGQVRPKQVCGGEIPVMNAGHPRRRRRRQSRKTRRRKFKGAPSNKPHRGPYDSLTKAESSGNLTNTGNSEGFVPPTGRSWTRPGWYLEAAPLHPAPRGRRAGRPAGPGLPNGDETGDDD